MNPPTTISLGDEEKGRIKKNAVREQVKVALAA
jgi:hypothetical protein